MSTDFPVEILPFGDSAVLLRWESIISPDVNRHVQAMLRALESDPLATWKDLTPGYASLTVFYDPSKLFYEDARTRIMDRFEAVSEEAVETPQRTVDVPVWYGGEAGPDLPFVAEHARLTSEEVIELHASADYWVYFLGFAPGFPYLGGMPEAISAPRQSRPRLSVLAGSVGIAGFQTGIYPFSTPGGWQIIGRTPLSLFDPDHQPPTLFLPGERLRFKPISEGEFRRSLQAFP